MTFNIGDKVVYPMHGAGIIEAIEEKEVLGEKQRYYIMKLPIGEMKVMIPMDNVDGDRAAADHRPRRRRESVPHPPRREVSRCRKTGIGGTGPTWRRSKAATSSRWPRSSATSRSATGRKGLSTGERKMLDNARQILISELVLAQDTTEEQVETTLNDLLR